ncbi:MAG: 5-formyltetrahydrofolate cyclo-ligase [Streptosporangiaceae bacterium]|nr:5-formyltetrahydrofolate cyclo-ligase [Streptosporangiaceae bacterium]
MSGGDVERDAKWALRRRLITARRAVPAAVRQAEAAALAAAALAGGALMGGQPGSVCAYWPVGSEPGSPELLENLTRRGCQVLLPLVDPPGLDPLGPLNWAEYTGAASLRAGPLGLLEPTGPALGCAAIATAVLVLVPALAVDRRGIRLGRGGGHYDRTLPLAAPGTPLVAIVRDDEVLASVPVQPHDVPVTAALTPQRGLFPLG